MCQTVMKAKAPPDLYKHDCASLLVYLSIILLVYLYLILHPPPKAKIRDVKAGGKGNVSLDAKGLCNTRVATVLVLLVLGLGPVFTFTRFHDFTFQVWLCQECHLPCRPLMPYPWSHAPVVPSATHVMSQARRSWVWHICSAFWREAFSSSDIHSLRLKRLTNLLRTMTLMRARGLLHTLHNCSP